MYPRIDSPCPLKAIQLPEQGNFHCGLCKRDVHDLSAMDESERTAFLQQCSGEVCVSYKVRANIRELGKGALAGMFLVTASGLAVSVAAAPDNPQVIESPQASAIVPEDIGTLPDDMSDMVLVGGVHLPEKEAGQEDVVPDSNSTLQLIPVVEERDEQ
jgi:hypothetical protein